MGNKKATSAVVDVAFVADIILSEFDCYKIFVW